ncbi:hypothetical protein CYG48_22135 (plasmid) [Neorhizobium sp. SOG26]|uniref:hypothetical protein n=1 Tax=Neorhizobium sp. SOG26 TaxID=2060726 RepID=UPI000E8A8C2D|nr:hypothetical protein [Neorhizobium sp. SOG26]AXV18539.1 hypothetical protein CYG48_22135 [Neorhizobium sp. SOG26]
MSQTSSIQPEDNAGYDMRSMMKLDAITAQIESILRRFGPGTSDNIAVAASLSRDIFGIDVRTSAINQISEQQIIDLIPKAEGCLLTLQALEKSGYIHAVNGGNFAEKFAETICALFVKSKS